MNLLSSIKHKYLKSKAINEAKKRLTNSPFDIFHNLDHHEHVWLGCKRIIAIEGLNVDEDALEIACYWHDVFKGKGDEEEKLIEESLTKLGLDTSTVNKVVKTISEHSMGKEQTIEESKILFDSDKIELVSTARWKYAFDAQARKEISIEQRDRYIKEWNRRMPLLEGHLHYKSANEEFSRSLRMIKEWLDSIGRLDDKGEFTSEI